MKPTRFGLLLVPAVSAAMLAFGCSDRTSGPGVRICVDREGHRVPDDRCSDRRYSGGAQPFYLWYIMSRGGAVPGVGGVAHGGSFVTPGSRGGGSSEEGGVSRGGFGSSAGASEGVGE